MVSLSFFLFVETKLYSDALLQVFFLALNVYGWLNWNKAAAGAALPVRWQGARPFLLWAGIGLLASLGWGFLMHRYTDAAFPYWDASHRDAEHAGAMADGAPLHRQLDLVDHRRLPSPFRSTGPRASISMPGFMACS